MIEPIRKIERVMPDGELTLYLPELSDEVVEIIVLPRSTNIERENIEAMRLQEKTGFASEVLANPAEDVWNDL
jgi:hypothetical protein